MLPQLNKWIVLNLLIASGFTGLSQPVSLDTSVSVTWYTTVQKNAVRIEISHFDSSLYYITFSGNIYRLTQNNGTIFDTLIASPAQHNVNFLQGIAIRDSIIYISGNHKAAGTSGYGIVSRAIIQSGGSLLWDNILTTVPYESSPVLFDHAFGSIVISDAGDSLYISSGSRTDHGEIQSVNGLFPGARDVPLTSMILKIPVSLSNYILNSDSASLDSTGFVFARGFRNNFDMAFNRNGDLIGVENSGERDDPEEINWLQQGHHYGFPWEIGGHITPQQFPGYDPSTDLLVNHNTLGWSYNFFYNDSAYPQKPSGLVTTPPIANYGPYADKSRNATGEVVDASDNSTFISSMTPHRAPLGLVFDRAQVLGNGYTGEGLFLCYTIGTNDSSSYSATTGIGPFLEPGQELLLMKMQKDTVNMIYTTNLYPVITGFNTPVDAALDSNILYVIEHRRTNDTTAAHVWKVTLPLKPISSIGERERKEVRVFPNPSTGLINISFPANTVNIVVCNSKGQQVLSQAFQNQSNTELNLNENGVYFIRVITGKETLISKVIICK